MAERNTAAPSARENVARARVAAASRHDFEQARGRLDAVRRRDDAEAVALRARRRQRRRASATPPCIASARRRTSAASSARSSAPPPSIATETLAPSLAASDRRASARRKSAASARGVENFLGIECRRAHCRESERRPAAAMPSAAISAANCGAEPALKPAHLDAAARGDFDDAVAVRPRRRAQFGECGERDGADRQQPHQQTVAGRHRRRQAGTGAAALRNALSGRSHAAASALKRREACIDIIAARMPKAAPPRGVEPFGNRGGGLRIFAQQKVAHVGVGDVGVVQQIEQFARRPRPVVCREGDQPVDGLGKLGGAARAVAHLAGDEARIDRARAHDARQAPPTAPARAAAADRSCRA